MYGYPGDGINSLLGAFDRAAGDLEFIQAQARGDGRVHGLRPRPGFTGRGGLLRRRRRGPGAVHLLNCLYDAKLDHQPVVAVVGQQKRLSLSTPLPQQEIALDQLFADVSEYCQMVMHRARPGTSSTGPSRPCPDHPGRRHHHHPERHPGGEEAQPLPAQGARLRLPAWAGAAPGPASTSTPELRRAADVPTAEGNKVRRASSARARRGGGRGEGGRRTARRRCRRRPCSAGRSCPTTCFLRHRAHRPAGQQGRADNIMQGCDTLLMVRRHLPVLGVAARGGAEKGPRASRSDDRRPHDRYPLSHGRPPPRQATPGDPPRPHPGCSSARRTRLRMEKIEKR